MQRDDLLVWMDLETTGLSPHSAILEATVIITNNELDPVASPLTLVVHHSPETLKEMNEWCLNQHTHSGLIQDVQDSQISLEETQRQLLALVQIYCVERSAPLCGSSIHVDRTWLAAQMPELERYVHYRNIDVSSIRELVSRWLPERDRYDEEGDIAHRSLADIQYSLRELRYYRSQFFNPFWTNPSSIGFKKKA